MTHPEKPMNVNEAANFLGYSKTYLYELIQKNEVPHYRPTGRKVIFLPKDLIEWVKSGKVKTNQEIEAEAANHIKQTA
jgi:excisionase family DNA binding protein